MSTQDLGCLVDHLIGTTMDSLPDNFFTEIETGYWLAGRVYKHGDVDDYKKIVSSKANISYSEYHRNKTIINNKSHKIIFVDTEFPVNELGYYVIY